MIPSRSPRARGPCRSREGAYCTFITHRSHMASTQTTCKSTHTHCLPTSFQSAQAASPRSPAPPPSRRSRLRHCPPPNRLRGAGLVLSFSVLSLRVCLNPLLVVALMLWQATRSVQSVGKNKNARRCAPRGEIVRGVGICCAVAPRPPLRWFPRAVVMKK